MFKRLFWLSVGVCLGVGASAWLLLRLRRTAARYRAERIADDVSGAARRLRDDVKAAISEGRQAMREREAELREELDPRIGEPSLN